MPRVWVGLALLGACGGEDTGSPTPTGETGDTGIVDPTDGDGDGYGAADDCDDLDPTVSPGAEERCDGLDTDCDPSTPDPEGSVGRSDGGAHGSISEAVTEAGVGATVWICGGVWEENVVVERDLTVLGLGGPVIDGGGLAPGVTVVGGTVRLAGLGIRNGAGSPEGPFATNGGGIDGFGADGPLTIEDVTVSDSLAELAGGILFGPAGGSLVRATVEGNVSGNHGGGVYAAGDVVLEDVVLRDNIAAGYGGGLAVGDGNEVVVRRTTIEGNTGQFGAGLFSFEGARIELDATVVSGNTALQGGGGAYVWSGELVGGELRDNDGGDAGGGLLVYDGALVRDVVIEGNTAVSGGGLSLRGLVTLEGVGVDGNSAAEDGGSAYVVEASVTADAATRLTGGVSGSRGGGLMIVDGSWTGGAFADGQSREGGGVYVSGAGTGTTTLTDLAIEDNRAEQSGGGLFAGGAFTADRVSFARNLSLDRGGALYATFSATGAIADSDFVGNSAVKRGGAIYPNDGAILNLSDCEIRQNVAERGGGLYLLGGSTVTLSRCAIEANGDATTLSGGGARITDGLLVSNDSDWGAAAADNQPDDTFVELGQNAYRGYEADETFTCDAEGCSPLP